MPRPDRCACRSACMAAGATTAIRAMVAVIAGHTIAAAMVARTFSTLYLADSAFLRANQRCDYERWGQAKIVVGAKNCRPNFYENTKPWFKFARQPATILAKI